MHTLMKVDHVPDVHAIDVISAKDRDEVIIEIVHQIEILEYRVSRTSVPRLVG